MRLFCPFEAYFLLHYPALSSPIHARYARRARYAMLVVFHLLRCVKLCLHHEVRKVFDLDEAIRPKA